MERGKCPQAPYEVDYDSYFHNIGYSYIEMARLVAQMEAETAHIINLAGRHGQGETTPTVSRNEARPPPQSHK